MRPYEPGDASALARVFARSVRHAASRDYTPDQVRAWASATPDVSDFSARATDGRSILVAVAGSGSRVVGYGDIEPDGHLDHLYCEPEFVGRGVGGTLYDGLEDIARHSGVATIFVEASEAARRLLQRKGFRVCERREFLVDGVRLHNYAMEKSLLGDEQT